MDARTLLVEQTRHVYGNVEWATDVDLADALWPAGGPRPSIAWILGHLVLQVATTVEAVAETRVEGVGDRTGEPHWGVRTDGDWRGLRASWSRALAVAAPAFEALPEASLALPPAVEVHPAFRDRLVSRAVWWSGHVYHVDYHLGQIGTLRAERGLEEDPPQPLAP